MNVTPVTGVPIDEDRAELVRLDHRLLGEFAAGEAGGEPEIVLDAHAAAGLSARRRPLENDGVEAFRGAVDRRRQPRRAGADDGQVVDRALERLADARAVRQLAVGRIAQHVRGAHDDRRLRFGDAEVSEERVDIGVRLEIGPGEEHQVLRQEVADAKGVRRVARADHADARERAGLAHELAARHERAQDDVAEIRALIDDFLEDSLDIA